MNTEEPEPPFAIEIELENPTTLLEDLNETEDPDVRAVRQVELFRVLTTVHPDQYRPALLTWLGHVRDHRVRTGDLNGAYACADEALGHCRQLEDQRDEALARCLHECGQFLLALSRPAEALDRYREACGLSTASEEILLLCRHELAKLLRDHADDLLRAAAACQPGQ